MEKELLKTSWQKGIDYSAYRDMINALRQENKTTGTNHSADYLNYTDLNIARMNKWDKIFNLDNDTIRITQEKKELWLVISEAWCGDAAHALPILNKIAEANQAIEMRIVLRDLNLELMDQFLTNGGRSIPKLIILNENYEVINVWGPRPKAAQDLMVDLKAQGLPKEEITKKLQVWYSRNRGKAIAEELLGLIT
jgi:hypothetical protein